MFFDEEKKEQEEVFDEIHSQIKQQAQEENQREQKLAEELKYKQEEEEKMVEEKEVEEIADEEEDVTQIKEKSQAALEAELQEKKRKKKEKKPIFAYFKVDLWRTKLHKDEWGIRLDAVRTQKDRQWTRDMDLIGEVKLGKEEYGKLAIREELWKAKDPLEKRFVMKLFTASGYWRASIELLQGETIANSLTTKESCPVYVCNFKHTRNLYRIKRLAHFPRFQGQVLGFSYLDEEDRFRSFVLDDKRLTLGSDWYVKDIYNEKIAKINGKFANIGGKFDIYIYDETLAQDRTFYTMLILFSTTLRYFRDVKKNIRRTIKKIKKTKEEVKLDDSETNLYLNPRKLSI